MYSLPLHFILLPKGNIHVKKSLKISAIIILFSVLSGCFPTGEIVQYSNYTDNNTNTTYEVNTTIYDTVVPLFSGQRHEWDTDALKKTLVPDFFNFDGNSIKTEEIDAEIGKCFKYSFDDGRELDILGDGAFVQYYRDTDNISYYGIGSGTYGTYYGFSEEDMHNDYPLIEYDDFKSSQAVEIANKTVTELGIPSLSSPMIFSCESDISDFTLSLYPEAAEKYSEDDIKAMKGNKAYYILYTQAYNGVKLPVGMPCFETDNINSYFTTVDFIIDKNGIISFRADNVMDLIPLNESAQICTSDEALETCKNTIGLSMEVNGAIIKGGELTYISNRNSDGTYSFFPAWKFIKHVNDPDEVSMRNTFYQAYFYNAVTRALLM